MDAELVLRADQLIPLWRDGQADAWLELEALMKERLKERTSTLFAQLDPRNILRLQGTVVDIFDQLIEDEVLAFDCISDFFGLCAHAMRAISSLLFKRLKPKRGDRKSRSLFENIRSQLTFSLAGHPDQEQKSIDVVTASDLLTRLEERGEEDFELAKILELYFYEQLTQNEIAAYKNLSRDQVARQIKKGLETMRVLAGKNRA